MRHLTTNSRTYFFTWNSASEQDWKKIESIFIAAFVDSYKNIQLSNLKTSLSSYLKAYFEEEYHKIMTQGPEKRIHYLVTYFEDQPVAFFTAEHNWKTGRAYLRLATVSPKFYRQGIAKFMIDEVCRHFDTDGRIELIARKGIDAISFYRACGFNEVHEFDFNEPSTSVGFKSMIRSYFDKPDILRPPADDAVSDPSVFIGMRM